MERAATTVPSRGSAVPVELTAPRGRIAVEPGGGCCTVRFTGEIDIAFSRDDFFRITAAVRDSGLAVVVDCSGVTFFSAEGIRMLDVLRSAAPGRRLADLVTSAAVDRLSAFYPMDRRVAA